MKNLAFQACFGGDHDDYGPCPCGNRATIPVAIPNSWVTGEDEEKISVFLGKEDFSFAMGYDFRRVFGPVRKGEYLLNFSACPDCCQRAADLGIAREVEDVGFSSNVLTEAILDEVGERLGLED